MSHPIPGHDYSEQTRGESDKDYSNRKKKAGSALGKKKAIAKKMAKAKQDRYEEVMEHHKSRRLSKEKHAEMVSRWPVMQKDFKPKSKFGEIAAGYFKSKEKN